MRVGATTLPLASWQADPRHPENSRQTRLQAMHQLVTVHGLQVIELTLDLAFVYPQIFDAAFYQSVADLQQELGFDCTVHLPFLWVDLASLNEPVRRTSVKCLLDTAALIAPIRVETLVIHLWGLASAQILTQFAQPAQRQTVLAATQAQAGRSLAELCERMAPRNLCVENLEAPGFAAALPLIEQHGTSICLDVGHLAWTQDNALQFVERHGALIREIHLHDARTITSERHMEVRDHLALGDGTLDYAALLHKLETMAFCGTVILEVNSQADLATSLERIRAIR